MPKQTSDPSMLVLNEKPAPMLRRCKICGETYDLRKFEQAFHHDEAQHGPVKQERAER